MWRSQTTHPPQVPVTFTLTTLVTGTFILKASNKKENGSWSLLSYKRPIVTFGNVVYRVTTAHTSEGTFIDNDESC